MLDTRNTKASDPRSHTNTSYFCTECFFLLAEIYLYFVNMDILAAGRTFLPRNVTQLLNSSSILSFGRRKVCRETTLACSRERYPYSIASKTRSKTSNPNLVLHPVAKTTNKTISTRITLLLVKIEHMIRNYKGAEAKTTTTVDH